MTEVIKGVRVEGNKVIVLTRDNDTARFVCGVIVEALHMPQSVAPVDTALPQIDPEMIPAGCALPAFDGMEEAQMAARRADERRLAAL